MWAEQIKGHRIEGTYCGVSFSGVASDVEANWEEGSRNAVNVYVTLDTPISVSGEFRDSVALLGLNVSTGRRFGSSWTRSMFEHVRVADFDKFLQ